MTNKHAPPVLTLSDGPIRVSIWENNGANGTYYAVTASRTFRDEEGRLSDATSFVGVDLLRLSELLRSAYSKTSDMRQAAKPTPEQVSSIDEDTAEPSEDFNRQSRRKPRRAPAPR
ncbi:MAG: hypothetical protein AAGF94_09125 [Pseudomonadota bacterium]